MPCFVADFNPISARSSQSSHSSYCPHWQHHTVRERRDTQLMSRLHFLRPQLCLAMMQSDRLQGLHLDGLPCSLARTTPPL